MKKKERKSWCKRRVYESFSRWAIAYWDDIIASSYHHTFYVFVLISGSFWIFGRKFFEGKLSYDCDKPAVVKFMLQRDNNVHILYYFIGTHWRIYVWCMVYGFRGTVLSTLCSFCGFEYNTGTRIKVHVDNSVSMNT